MQAKEQWPRVGGWRNCNWSRYGVWSRKKRKGGERKFYKFFPRRRLHTRNINFHVRKLSRLLLTFVHPLFLRFFVSCCYGFIYVAVDFNFVDIFYLWLGVCFVPSETNERALRKSWAQLVLLSCEEEEKTDNETGETKGTNFSYVSLSFNESSESETFHFLCDNNSLIK